MALYKDYTGDENIYEQIENNVWNIKELIAYITSQGNTQGSVDIDVNGVTKTLTQWLTGITTDLTSATDKLQETYEDTLSKNELSTNIDATKDQHLTNLRTVTALIDALGLLKADISEITRINGEIALKEDKGAYTGDINSLTNIVNAVQASLDNVINVLGGHVIWTETPGTDEWLFSLSFLSIGAIDLPIPSPVHSKLSSTPNGTELLFKVIDLTDNDSIRLAETFGSGGSTKNLWFDGTPVTVEINGTDLTVDGIPLLFSGHDYKVEWIKEENVGTTLDLSHKANTGLDNVDDAVIDTRVKNLGYSKNDTTLSLYVDGVFFKNIKTESV